jgi:hypothetical protein
MRNGFQIKCKDAAQLVKRMEILFKAGLVFTNDRHKTVKEMKENYSAWNRWTHIYVGHDEDCKRVMNTGNTNRESIGYNGSKITPVIFTKFVKEILPTL